MRFFVLSLYICLCAWVRADAPAPFLFNMGSGGYAPYTIVEPGQPPRGIVFEVMQRILGRIGNYQVHAVEVPRKRVDMQLESAQLDATARAIEWMTDPDLFPFSHPIIKVREVLVVNVDAPYRTLDDLKGKVIGARRGYFYISLGNEFTLGTMQREDADTDDSMLKKLQLRRSDAAVMNEATARWMIRSQGFVSLRILPLQIDPGVELRVMFAPRHLKLLDDFNRELAQMRDSGELDSIVRSYLGP